MLMSSMASGTIVVRETGWNRGMETYTITLRGDGQMFEWQPPFDQRMTEDQVLAWAEGEVRDFIQDPDDDAFPEWVRAAFTTT